ncbi:MAG: hypothetical protein RIQ81_1906 [Pseudomonadota bacterium]|jgi:hypothetical protein
MRGAGRLMEFRKLPKASSEALSDFKLAIADQLPGEPVRYEASRDFYDWSPGYEEPHLHVTFPSLSRSQFEGLKARYGFGLSRIQYRAGEAYTLADFLMPFMQATIDHEFKPETQKDYTKIASNCWGTAYEVIRTSRRIDGDSAPDRDPSASVTLFYADTGEMQAVLQDDSRSQLIAQGPSMADLYEEGKRAGQKMLPGDTVLLLDSEGKMEHAITNVDQDVWFEKVGYSAGAPYRLTRTADFFHQVAGGRTVEWRRFPRGGLPDPADIFKSWQYLAEAEDGSTEILDQPVERPLTRRKVLFVFDELGRARLEAQAYQPMPLNGVAGWNFSPTLSKHLTSLPPWMGANPPF